MKENYRMHSAGNRQEDTITMIMKRRMKMMRMKIKIKSTETNRSKISNHYKLILGIR
jgi:hypothetical protein